jgi:hypothetical protein
MRPFERQEEDRTPINSDGDATPHDDRHDVRFGRVRAQTELAFAGAQNPDASKSVFNDVGLNQINIGNVNVASSPGLAPAFSEASLIASTLKQIQTNRQQFSGLMSSIETLLQTLDSEYLADRLLESQTSVSLQNLTRYVCTPFDRIYLSLISETAY